MLQDTTAQKSIEDERAKLIGCLEQSNEDLSRFGHIVSHDLRSPLRTIGSYVQLLARELQGRVNGTSQECMTHVLQGVAHMDALITSLLKYAEIGDAHFALEKVNLEEVLQSTLNILDCSLLDNNATITHDLLPCVQGDSVLLVELFQNLIGNALKYRSSEDPKIAISVQTTCTEWTPGSGVGLAVCKRIVERHGGRIWVQSSAGCGAAFFVSLPKVRAFDEHLHPGHLQARVQAVA